MERTIIKKICIDNNRKVFGKNAFVRGKITGYRECICRTCTREYANYESQSGDKCIIIAEATEAEHAELQEMIEKRYPGLCTFEEVKDDDEIKKHLLVKKN